MKSMPFLFAAVIGLAFHVVGAGLGAQGTSFLVSSAVSPQTWMRSCSYAGPGGMAVVEIEASRACPAVPSDEGLLVRQAGLVE